MNPTPKPPLGLPEGSVRAILVILIVLTFCVMTILGKPTPEQFATVALAVITCYFAARNNGAPPNAQAPVGPAPTVTVVPVPVPTPTPDPTNPANLPDTPPNTVLTTT